MRTILPILVATTLGIPLNHGPVIGILTTPWCESSTQGRSGFLAECENSPTSGFSNLEVKFLEQAGAKIVPIRYDATESELEDLFNSVNGILYTGGSLSLLPNTTYYRTARFLYDKAIKAQDMGDSVPILGICMGFQLLAVMTADDYSVLDHSAFDSENVVWPLEITQDGYESRFLKNAPEKVIRALEMENMTINWHHDGVVPEKFFANKHLSSFYRIISYNHDLNGKKFISTMEGWNRPIFAVQWHPEAVQFDWDSRSGFINRSPMAIRSMQHVADHFVEEARMNEHKFISAQAEEERLIYNFKPEISRSSYEAYLFHRQ